jgi:hypothetical protein
MSADSETTDECAVGAERCPCTAGGRCDPGLVCRSARCVRVETEGAGGMEASGGSAFGATAGAGAIAGGSGGVTNPAPDCDECLEQTLGSLTVGCEVSSAYDTRTPSLTITDGLAARFDGQPCTSEPRQNDTSCGQYVDCGNCTLAISYSADGGYMADVDCGSGNERGGCPPILAASSIFKASAPCITPGSSSGGGPTGGACRSHAESKCADCENGEYCEPGSSGASVYCLIPCGSAQDCCPGVPCVSNPFDYFPATICTDML